MYMCYGYGYPYTQSKFGYKANKINKVIILSMHLFILRYIEMYLTIHLTEAVLPFASTLWYLPPYAGFGMVMPLYVFTPVYIYCLHLAP